ncbi:hypothetical protein FDG2_3284 [Candidatus Protofrankia californiensis]|uniref:Uncharacterized protein n=1 Tax=Candidatus Protofrankia californiensis TaxID=1839754 RepID=A0A1C3NZ97_9ACTN|nr:hypothetical protein FDG2_3284 [Candidatus Protofrankia californiensis]
MPAEYKSPSLNPKNLRRPTWRPPFDRKKVFEISGW